MSPDSLLLLHLAGLQPVFVQGMKLAAAIVHECGVVLIREGLSEEQQCQVADRVLASAAARLRESPPV